MACDCSGVGKAYHTFYSPEHLIGLKLGSFYQDCPIMSRVVLIPLAAINGVAKTILFPLLSLIGTLVMPIIALIRACLGKRDTADWLKAWTFSVLGFAGFVAFCAVSAFYLPLTASAGIFLGGMCVSIAFHVYRAVQEPPLLK